MTDVHERISALQAASRRAESVRAAISARSSEASPQPRLEPVAAALAILGDPHRAIAMIHITGTNGKTSTARMIGSLLRAAGLRTGTFTSPHLVSLNERIMIDDAPISDDALIRSWDRCGPAIDAIDRRLAESRERVLTFFEVITIVAFAAFAAAGLDVNVIEVGMGGEWDATNVADAAVAVFTPTDLDHTAILGKTVGEIARTKAGIIKRGTLVVTAQQSPSALVELREAARRHLGNVIEGGRDFGVRHRSAAQSGQFVDLDGGAGQYSDLFVPLLGPFQAKNAAVAVAAVEAYLTDGRAALDEDVVRLGFSQVSSPGRMQVFPGVVDVVVDAAHNPHGLRATTDAIIERYPGRAIVAVVGVLADKDVEAMLEALVPRVSELVVTAPPSPRALSTYDLAVQVIELAGRHRVRVTPDVQEALGTAERLAHGAGPRGGVVLVVGSIVLAGHVVELLDRRIAEHGKQRPASESAS